MDLRLMWARLTFRFPTVRAEFYEDMSAALGDGEDVVSYLSKRAARAKQTKDSLGPLFRVWVRRMDNTSFAGAVRGSVPEAESMVLQASEEASRLGDDLEYLAEVVRLVAGMKKAAIFSLIVPSIVLTLVCALMWAFSFFFVPILSSIIPPEKWPGAGQILRALAEFTTHYGLVLLIGLGALGGGIVFIMRTYTGRLRRKLDEWPLFSIYRAFHGSIALVSLAAMMGAGLSLVESLHKVASNSNKWTKWHIANILRRLDTMSGEAGKAFDTGMLPRKILNRIIDRAERTKFDEALRKIGATSLTKMKQEIEAKAKVINVIMMLVAGILMGVLMYGFLDTVYSIQNAIRKF